MVISELSEKLDAQHIHYEMTGGPSTYPFTRR